MSEHDAEWQRLSQLLLDNLGDPSAEAELRAAWNRLDELNTACPACGSEPGCNIDCQMCATLGLPEAKP